MFPSNLKLHTTTVTTKLSNELAFSRMQKVFAVISLARKRRQFRDRAFQSGLTPISPRRKANQTVKKRFCLKNYTGAIIFKQ